MSALRIVAGLLMRGVGEAIDVVGRWVMGVERGEVRGLYASAVQPTGGTWRGVYVTQHDGKVESTDG